MAVTLRELWPIVAVLGTVGAIVIAFTRCAVSHVAVLLAVRLYSNYDFVRMEKRNEWLQILEEMNPSERPAHAGSLLWAGFVGFVRRVSEHSPTERFFYARAVVRYCHVADARAGRPEERPRRYYFHEFTNAFRKHTHTRTFIDFFAIFLRDLPPRLPNEKTIRQLLDERRPSTA